jgi:hypothetical protein
MNHISRKKCRKCKHYYITWDRRLPHGCRAMNFKSRQLPSEVVFASCGKPCQLFEPKTLPSENMSSDRHSGKLKGIVV